MYLLKEQTSRNLLKPISPKAHFSFVSFFAQPIIAWKRVSQDWRTDDFCVDWRNCSFIHVWVSIDVFKTFSLFAIGLNFGKHSIIYIYDRLWSNFSVVVCAEFKSYDGWKMAFRSTKSNRKRLNTVIIYTIILYNNKCVIFRSWDIWRATWTFPAQNVLSVIFEER